MKRKTEYYYRTLKPSNQKDRTIMHKILKNAQQVDECNSYHFGYLPLDDDRHRCPPGAQIYTPYGWNNIQETARAFYERNEDVWLVAY